MRTHRDRVAGTTALALITIAVSGGSAAAQATAIKSVLPPEINCQGATAREEALIRKQIQIMHPEVLPLRVIFVPHWKYVDDTRVFRLHVPKGYTSSMFTHLPSRTVFIDARRHVNCFYSEPTRLSHWQRQHLDGEACTTCPSHKQISCLSAARPAAVDKGRRTGWVLSERQMGLFSDL